MSFPDEIFGNAGFIFFRKNTLVDDITIILNNIEYSYVGVYYKISKTDLKYECWYINLCAIDNSHGTKCDLYEIWNDKLLKTMAVKKIKEGKNSMLEIRFRMAIATLINTKSINMDDTIFETFNYNKEISDPYRTPSQLITRIYESLYIHGRGADGSVRNTQMIMKKYKLIGGNDKEDDHRFEIVKLLGESLDGGGNFLSSENLNKILEDVIYFEYISYPNIYIYDDRTVYLELEKIHDTNKNNVNNYITYIMDIILNDFKFREHIFEKYKNNSIVNSLKDTDFIDEYISEPEFEIYYKYWNSLIILLNSSINTGIFDVVTYNKNLMGVAKDISFDYNELKLCKNSNVSFYYDQIYYKFGRDTSADTDVSKLDNNSKPDLYIYKHDSKKLDNILKELTYSFSKFIYIGNQKSKINLYEVELYIKKISTVFKIFGSTEIDIPDFGENTCNIKFFDNSTNKIKEKCPDGSDVENYLNTFITLWNAWNNFLMIIKPMFKSTLVVEQDIERLIEKIYKLCFFDIRQYIYIKKCGSLCISEGHKYKLTDFSVEQELNVNLGRISHSKILVYTNNIGKLFSLFIYDINKYISSYETCKAKWSYTLFTQHCEIINHHIKYALDKLLINTKFESFILLPDTIKNEWFIHIQQSPAFDLNLSEFEKINNEMNNILKMYSDSDIPVINIKTLITSLNMINKGIHLNLPIIDFTPTDTFSAIVTCEDSPEISQEFILSDGKKIHISLDNPYLDNLKDSYIEEILETINCMAKNNIQLDNIQAKLVKRLSTT